MLTVKNVHKSYGNYKALEDVYLEVGEGSIFGLVGINGSGKSTLLRIIAGIFKPDRGAVFFDDKDTYENKEIRSSIVYVSDDPYYPFGSTIDSLKLYYQSFYEFDEEKYYAYLKLFGLNPHDNISHFSKGMRRQASLILGMALSPKLLLLDEAFDGLDPLVRLKFKKALNELIEEKQISVIISSHNLKELDDICDSFAILENHHVMTYGDLNLSKDQVHKYQLAFKEEKIKDDFVGLDFLSFQSSGRVINAVIKGDKDFVVERLMKYEPILLDVLPVNFEELFIYEIEKENEND